MDDQSTHVRRASEKVKKRMKMADLKAFVETKLLSKSEKTLEKIGRDEPKVFYGQVLASISYILTIAWNMFVFTPFHSDHSL
jgi:regulatory protein YycI of two-component signal transduction system YycFG